MNQDQILNEFQKNAGERVKMGLRNYKGRDCVFIWIYFNKENGEDDYRPSRKGVMMSASHIPELKKGVDRALEVWEKQQKRQV